MAGLVARKPAVGFAAGALFGALGVLLLGIDDGHGAARLLFPLSGGFFLFIGILSIASAAAVLLRSRRG